MDNDNSQIETINSTPKNKNDKDEEVPIYKQMKDAKYKLQKEINEAKRI